MGAPPKFTRIPFMQNTSTPAAQAQARSLRRAMTDSERRLWGRLRLEQLGVKFRRQHPLGPYIADFACLAPKLIVELDGSQHGKQIEHDERRDAFFRGQGFQVLRFGSNQPFLNLDGILTVIAEAIHAAASGQPPSQPSPSGGRGKSPFQASPGERTGKASSLPSPSGGRGTSHSLAVSPGFGQAQTSSGAQ